MTPPTRHTWSRRGLTPVVRVRGRSRRRLSVAALACYKPGERSRQIYRPCPDARPDGRKSFSWKDSGTQSVPAADCGCTTTGTQPVPAPEEPPAPAPLGDHLPPQQRTALEACLTPR